MPWPARLQAEALTIVHDLALLDLLRPYGEAALVGSVALGLVVKRDTDAARAAASPKPSWRGCGRPASCGSGCSGDSTPPQHRPAGVLPLCG